MVIAIAMLLSSTAVQAQTEQSKKQRISREELAEKQARHIAHELALDDATTQKYVAEVCRNLLRLPKRGVGIGTSRKASSK